VTHIPNLIHRFAGAGAIALATAIKDMRAVLSVNLLQNHIGPDQATALVSILKEHPTLKSLCGNRGDETALDMGGKMNGADDAIMLAAEIVNNRAISAVIMHKFPLPIQKIVTKPELDFSSKELDSLDAIVIAALLPLNVSGQYLFIAVTLISLSIRGHYRCYL
jgi:hypothetical protein